MAIKPPQNRLYTSFSSSLEQKTNAGKQSLIDAEEKVKKSWAQTVEPSEDSCLNVATIHNRFNRDDLQNAYNRYLLGELIPIEATTIKMQNGFIAADEQAYRIRHYGLPRALATGYMDNTRWANGLIQYLLTNRIKKIQELANEDYKKNIIQSKESQ